MFKLWCLAEGDLLREGNTYRLVNTGQARSCFTLSPDTGLLARTPSGLFTMVNACTAAHAPPLMCMLLAARR